MKYFLPVIPLLLVFGCTREPIKQHPVEKPAMLYQDFGGRAIRFGEHQLVDLDTNHIDDLLFSTMLVGDAMGKRDRRQYYVTANFDVFLPTGGQEQMPALNEGDAVTQDNLPGFHWFNASSVLLAEKIIEETGPVHWEGNWKTVSHKFIPLQIRRGNVLYMGWMEVSFDMEQEILILHRGAVSLESGRTVRAGM